MAKLAPSSEARKIADSLKAMRRGDFGTPAYIAGSDGLKAVSADIEELRRYLLLFTEESAKAEAKYYRALSDVIHDLKAPLQVVIGYAECLSDGMDDRDYAKLISEKCLEMNDIVLNVISEAKKKVAGGKFEVVAVKDFLPEAVAASAAPVLEKGLRLKVSRSPKAAVYADVGAFRSVIGNLLSNAAKFTPKGGTVKVSVSAGKKYLRIRVSDNGKPIAPDDLEKVFDRYYTTDSVAGTGICLSSVKEIVNAHHGLVYALKRRRGAAFEIKLPRYEDKTVAPVSPAVKERRFHILMMLGYIFLPFGMLYSLFRIIASSAEIAAERRAAAHDDPDKASERELKRMRTALKKQNSDHD